MIALTQEKREELIAFVNASIEQRCTVYTLAKQRELEALRDQVALASLTTESSFTVLSDSREEDQYTFGVNKCTQDGFYDLYTAPPVPEINFGSDDDCEEGLKKHGLRTRSHGPSQLSDGFRCGFAWREHIIKRLNGLGE